MILENNTHIQSDTRNTNFLLSVGKTKQLINSELFANNITPTFNFVLEGTSIQDLLRSRGGVFWSIKNNIPEITLQTSPKVAFDVDIKSPELVNTTTLKTFGSSTKNITLIANKNMFKLDPGPVPIMRSTYNPEYWKSFIIKREENPQIPPAGNNSFFANPIQPDPVEAILGGELDASQELQIGTSPGATTFFNQVNSPLINTENTINTNNNVNQQTLNNNSLDVIVQSNVPPQQQSNTSFQNNSANIQVNSNINTEQSLQGPTSQVNPTGIQVNNSDGNAIFNTNLNVNVLPTFSLIPTINDKEFFDYAFDLSLPFTKKELSKIKTPVGAMSVDIKQTYNFFNKDYEFGINNNNVKEQLLPNLYVFCSELQNENTDRENTIFKQHITLNEHIDDVFVDVTNNKSEKIGEKDKGQYFDKFPIGINDLIKTEPNVGDILSRKFNNVITPSTNMDLHKSFNDKSSLFPMFFDINFTTENTTQFAQVLSDSQLSSVLIKDIIENNLVSKPYDFQETTIQTSATGSIYDRTVNTNKKSMKMWDIEEWVELISNNPVHSFNNTQNEVFLGSLNDEISLITEPQYSLYKNLLVVIFIGKLKTLIDENLRKYENILNGKLAYSENVFYKIEKSDTAGQVLQNFYIPNSNKVEVLRFIDTQVKYNKKYTYKIFTYQMVLGNKYHYELKTLTDDTANIDVINEPSVKLFEVLLHEFTGRIMDNPPIAPDINIIPYRGINNQVLINMNSGIGRSFLEPIIIEPTDNNIIKQLKEAQMINDDELMEYESDDHASFFEVYRIDKKPHHFSDFSGRRTVLVSTDISSLTLQSATAASFIDNVIPNKKYYYIFRTIDNHGHISNPTPIFQFELVDANGSVYPIIEVVELEKDMETKSTVKSAKKFIQISPTFTQKVVNEEKSNFIVAGKRIDSVLDAEKVHLGVEDEQVWEKRFKVRLTSKKTGKKIDFDIKYTHEHKRK